MAVKKQVYFNEYNVPMEKTIYFPLVSGLLQSYAQSIPLLKENYLFMPFVFLRDNPDAIVSGYDLPAVAAFSVSMWNMNLSLAVARKIKEKHPSCLIVFGGPQTPFGAKDFFIQHPFIDVTVRGEGEQAFADILTRFLESRDFSDIPGLSFRDPKTGLCVKTARERILEKDLDIFPSPYLTGVFDSLLDGGINFQVIIETNRGCPYSCSYCFWGQGGLSKRYRFFSLERVRAIVEWCGAHHIKYVFCADSNFGIFKRDLDIAGFFVSTKKKSGCPEKLRTCYAKNTKENIYKIGRLLHEQGMEKGITMSFQSVNKDALRNVGRKNIALDIYQSLQDIYNKEDIPVYTELILGLPGETYESFIEGINGFLKAGIKNQLFVYLCQVFPNTELADGNYQKKFKMATVNVPLNEIHAEVRKEDIIKEYEEIITATYSMPVNDWKRMVVFSWIMQLFHGMKMGFYILLYLQDRHKVGPREFLEYIALLKMKSKEIRMLKEMVKEFYSFAEAILQGQGRGRIMPEYGPIYWENEEVSFLESSASKEEFYREVLVLLAEFLDDRKIVYDTEELLDIVSYQNARIYTCRPVEKFEIFFRHNVPEYFDSFFSAAKAYLVKKNQVMRLENFKDYHDDRKLFAREIVVYGRKNSRMIYDVSWKDA
jgi:radical SAM superfamily enzyme YgiQ (UPF0313 family)